MQEIVCNYDFMYKHYRCHIDKKTIENDKIALKGTQIVGKTNEDVKWLDFSECKILTFPTNLHEFIPNITSLRINCCNLEHFSREHIKNFKSLVYFRIENCGLKKLKSDLFKNLNNLWHISFRNNELEDIEPQILENLPKLRFVDFRGNKNYDMWHDSSVASSNSLGEIKKDLVIKSDPLAMFFHQQELKLKE
ncbi:hypothetical protein PVAND_017163 [Polypedilum vanderplanki]|uniref:Uncharacterized protein n=1 Tax=Polypedilum vanderplanki TaxID=319348 RepID=A0A9J6BHB0_POLVA|nr:hypothetical protein PVAND_017163 [Polypedilum vanderplanki]